MIALSLAYILKSVGSPLSTTVSMITVVIIGIYVFSSLSPIIDTVTRITEISTGGLDILSTVLKAGGISIITHFLAGICIESGERSLSSIIEVAADVAILLLSMPMYEEIFQALNAILKR